METIAEYTEINGCRESMYLFLMHLYKSEVDESLFMQMKNAAYPEDGNTEITNGYRIIKGYLNLPHTDPLTDLAVDYAKVFLGAGIVDPKKVAYPYESVYTSQERLIMQDARDEMLRILRENKLGLENSYNIPEDHIFVQLEFMAHICGEIRKAFEKDDKKAAAILLGEQKQFIENHLLNWVPELCSDIKKFALTDFYKGLAMITEEYTKMDLAVVEDMLSACTTPE